MPIICHFKPSESLVIFIQIGVIPGNEFLSSYKAFHKNTRFEKSFNLLVDIRQAENSIRNTSALRKFADFKRQLSTKIAVIAPNDLSFGLARMYEVFSDIESVNFVVFHAFDAALAWLGLSEHLMNDL